MCFAGDNFEQHGCNREIPWQGKAHLCRFCCCYCVLVTCLAFALKNICA